ncbi:S9 family peptidase [Georgenia subflava]|uniref:Prolyl oligopeptidase family serine peptidase n=1 Tax=Georgenia subflava TaxID=1622177 RepID=A0A6N7EP74_9MICO|nr:S9 family peptidase [Georgenia subflava]MPV38667.1 prolyl oligopeptidase family serine peptidase [Georgenia subflava]
MTDATDSRPDTPFHDLDAYLALPRLGALTLSPDGTRLVTGVSVLDDDGTKYVTALWEVDPSGERPARRLTRGAKGESQARFTPAGDLLFIASRPSGGDDDEPAALWAIPGGGGEARVLVTHPGGVDGVHTPISGGTAVVQATALPRGTDLAEEKRLRDARKDKKVSAILHAGYPVRYWDHDLGPSAPRLYAVDLGDGGAVTSSDAAAAQEPELELRDLAPDAATHLVETSHDVAPDGTFLVTEWLVPEGRASQRSDLVRIDVASGDRLTLLAADEELEYGSPRISPDGGRLTYVQDERSTAEKAPALTLWLLDLASGARRRLGEGWDAWPGELRWLPDGTGLVMAADRDGRAPLFHVDATSGAVTRLTDDGAYSDLVVAPDGTCVYALRSSYAHPTEVVRVELTGITASFTEGSAVVTSLRGPAARPELPGTLSEVEATTEDGTRVRSWLAVPHGAGSDRPAPLLLWIHGGPLGSWNAWSWRWNPWLMVAQGYAVLLPDPALSTGYGQAMVQRGWGRWGAEPFTDLMAATDAAEALPEIDASRTAAMGGSFGGYMANWVAGHTDRFRAIVTHASLWALEGFGPTTDASYYWAREMSPAMQEVNSPHHHVGNIRTPMLVIHGDKDYRVPIGEGLRLWYELLSASGLPQEADGSTVHRFLYFPDENHWVLTPQHAKVWYQVVLGFLAEHVLGGGTAELPELLG